VRRTPIAHILFPKPNPVRPVPEFAWDAAEILSHFRELDVEIIVPVPAAPFRPLQRWGRLLRGGSAWSDEVGEALHALMPKPHLIHFVPVPGRSIESATAAVAAHLVARARAGRPALIQGSFLDSGGYLAAQVGRAVGCPSVAVAHGTDVRMARKVDGWEAGRHRRAMRALSRATEVVAISSTMAEDIALLGRKARVINYTARPDAFTLAPPAPSPNRLLFVGRLSREKGVDLLLEAMTRLGRRDVHLDLVGPTVPGFDAARAVEQHRLTERVRIRHEMPREHISELYAESTAVVLPSRAEGLSCVLVEALLVGRPVITTDVGASRELVNERVGALVSPDAPEELAAAIARVLESADNADWDPKSLREHALPFSWDANAETLRALTRELIDRGA
jgi:glycosyltransferase involved in cell wall biosynthesis